MRFPKSIGKILQFFIFLSIGGVLLYFSFRNVSLADLGAGLRSANYFWVSASVLVGILAYVVRAARWSILLETMGYKAPLRHTYDAVMFGYLSNFAFPRLGELTRCGLLYKTLGIPVTKGLGTVVIERVYDTVCLALICFGVFFLRYATFGKFIEDQIAVPAGIFFDKHFSTTLAIGMGVAAILAFYLLIRLVRSQRVNTKIKLFLEGLWDGILTGLRMKKRSLFLIYTLALWLCYWATSFTIMMAMPETHHLGLADALFLMVIGGLGWVVPVQGGLGSFHFIVSLGLGIYGISQDKGVVFATISHESQSIFMIILGLASLISAGFYLRRKQRNSQDNNNSEEILDC